MGLRDWVGERGLALLNFHIPSCAISLCSTPHHLTLCCSFICCLYNQQINVMRARLLSARFTTYWTAPKSL